MCPQLHPLSSPSPSSFICKTGKLLSVAPTSQGHCGFSQSDGTFLVWGQMILWVIWCVVGWLWHPCSLPPDARTKPPSRPPVTPRMAPLLAKRPLGSGRNHPPAEGPGLKEL